MWRGFPWPNGFCRFPAQRLIGLRRKAVTILFLLSRMLLEEETSGHRAIRLRRISPLVFDRLVKHDDIVPQSQFDVVGGWRSRW